MTTPILPHPSTPSQRLLNEAQAIVYRRWLELGASHDAALEHAALFALRAASGVARTADRPAAITHPEPIHARNPHMSERMGKLEAADFDRWVSLSEKAAREAVRKSSEAFAAALSRQIKRKRETAAIGTFVDQTVAIGAIRIRGEVPMSGFGSPAAMCVESGGTEARK